jgi:hypothetical protein
VPVSPVQGTRGQPAWWDGPLLAGPTRETRPDFWSSLTYLLTYTWEFSVFFFLFSFFSFFQQL